jgi:hypothetical protein
MVHNPLETLLVEETVASTGFQVFKLAEDFTYIFMLFTVRIFAHVI